LFMEDESFPSEFEVSGGMIFSRQAVTNSILQKLKPKEKPKGTVVGVDDIGSIMVRWDSGSSLSVAFGEDLCRRIHDDR